MAPRAALDTNVVFSRVLHELLGRAANTGGLLEPIWSKELVRETTRVLVENKGLDHDRAEAWAGLMANVFPAGRVDISQVPADLDLSALTSDDDDQHICALAIAGGADYILTFDKSFDVEALRALGIEVVEPDVFLSTAIDEEPGLFRDILTEQAAAWGDGRSRNSSTQSSEPAPPSSPQRPASSSTLDNTRNRHKRRRSLPATHAHPD
jgi:predicted nucleic acid-binding protein